MTRSSRPRMKWPRRSRRACASPGVSMLNRMGSIVRGLAPVLLVPASGRLAAAEEKRLPVPAVSIRAGELIRDDMITERAFAPNVLGVAMFIEGRQVLVGRMARRRSEEDTSEL